MNKPQVSIITPTFNRAHLIIETLRSVQKQTFTDWEWIIVDDGSSDDTFNIVQGFSASDHRIKYFQRPESLKKGANVCRNYGVSKSTGQYFVFLDSDDVIVPSCLQNRISHFDDPQLDLVVFSMGLIKNDVFEEVKYPDLSKKSRNDVVALFITGPLPWNMTRPMWKRDFFLKHKGFNEQMQLLDDDEFNLRAVNDAEIKFKFVDQTDCYYRIYEENNLKVTEAVFIKKIILSHQILLRTLNAIFTSEEKLLYRKSLQDNMVNFAYYVGDSTVAKKMFFRNIRYFFKNFNIPVRFKILFSIAMIAKLYPLNIKGFYKINKYFKDKLSNPL